VAAAWRQFVETGQVDETAVRPVVVQSWLRCRALGVDPRAPKLPVTLDARRLAAVREENQAFIDAALPFMDFLRTAVHGTGFILVLTERSGVVLEVFGDGIVLAMARENNYVPGCSRAEEVAGTNAISLALLEKKPVQLTGAEHWNVRHHRWTCASAPVFSPEGMLLGTVTLSGETTRAQLHTLGMVISGAEAIRERLCERETALRKRSVDTLLSSVLTSVSEAIITVDAAGLVSTINPSACRSLGTSAERATGKTLMKLFPGHPELAGLLSLDRDSAAFEVSAERAGGRAHFVLTPYVMQSGGQAEGAILALRERREFLNEVREFSGLNARFTFEDIVGESPALLRQIEVARVAARQNARVLILGETGTGKELFAQSIHNCSQRRAGPFVAINCAAIPRELMESELFGYRGGAFTGSRKGGQIGKLELADGGTLFLDEINQMPLDLQAKLLRALQDGTITRLGDSKPIRIDVRVIAAANEDLYAKSRCGEFRQDLYFRLSVVELSLPPLRERADDIPRIAQLLLEKLASRMGWPALVLSAAAREALCVYHWPGNVRELENVLETGAIMAEGGVIEPRHIAHRMQCGERVALRPERTPPAQGRSVREVEVDLIRNAIQEFNGNIDQVGQKLGLSRATVYRRMQQYGIVKSFTIKSSH
ncbi:MAG TPA: sigma 54-interacting transcriptional regulator, partial [Noviherbaspirillum sp.]|uniref:sigma-54-dependent Fis family transcriptional regulator n=1 Tax=Noviherbaspirillum sp. TaxID=1926288 RepID=UPI002B45EF34